MVALLVIALFAVLALAAPRFGVDSRPGFDHRRANPRPRGL